MNSRNQMKHSHDRRRSSEKSKNGEKQDEPAKKEANPWSILSAEDKAELARKKKAEEERARQEAQEWLWQEWTENWDKLSRDRKNYFLTQRICDHNCESVLRGIGWDYDYKTYRQNTYEDHRSCWERYLSGKFSQGKGYKLIKAIKNEEDPMRFGARSREEAEAYNNLLIEHIRDIDSHDGLSPLEYMIAKSKEKRSHRASIKEEPTHTDVMETFGEEIMKASDVEEEAKKDK